MGAGRPTDYNTDIACKIADLIASGLSIRKIAHRDDMPDRMTIAKWMEKHSEFDSQIARAREVKAENDAEELEEINEQVRSGELDPQQAAVISNNVKWVAGKLLPKKYGDAAQLRMANHDGTEDYNPFAEAMRLISGSTAGLPKDDK